MRKKFFIAVLFVSIVLGFIMRINQDTIYKYKKAECCICGKNTKCYTVEGKYHMLVESGDDDYSLQNHYVCSLKCRDELRND